MPRAAHMFMCPPTPTLTLPPASCLAGGRHPRLQQQCRHQRLHTYPNNVDINAAYKMMTKSEIRGWHSCVAFVTPGGGLEAAQAPSHHAPIIKAINSCAIVYKQSSILNLRFRPAEPPDPPLPAPSPVLSSFLFLTPEPCHRPLRLLPFLHKTSVHLLKHAPSLTR